MSDLGQSLTDRFENRDLELLQGVIISQIASNRYYVYVSGNTGTSVVAYSVGGLFPQAGVGVWMWAFRGTLLIWALSGTTPWLPVAPLFINSWTDYSAPYGPAYYRRIGDMVQMRGLVQSGSPATATVCTLPVGFRPQYEAIVTTACFGGNAEIRIATTGTVTPPSAYPAGTSPATWTSLAGVSFSVI